MPKRIYKKRTDKKLEEVGILPSLTEWNGKQDKLTAGTNITISGNTISSSVPLASSSARGGIQTGFSATGAKVPIQLSGEKAYAEITKGARQTAGFGEAYLSWGGKNFSGSYGPIDSARIPDLGSDRIAFTPASCWTIEYSQDSGSTWTDYGASDANKLQLTSTGATFVIGKASSSRLATEKDRLRLTLTTTGKIYSVLNKFAIYLSTNGSNGCYCTLMARTKANLDAGNDTWVTFANKVSVSGWSGWNIINTNGIKTHGNSSGQYAQLRFIFGCTSGSAKYAGLQVNKIKAFGGVGWTTPSNRATYGTIYSYDYNQNAIFPKEIYVQSGTAYNYKVLVTGKTNTFTGTQVFNSGKIYLGQGDSNAIDLGSDGRINSGNSTLIGFIGGAFTLGHSTYNTNIRGKATRLTYNGNDLALKSDLKTKYKQLDVTYTGRSVDTVNFLEYNDDDYSIHIGGTTQRLELSLDKTTEEIEKVIY